MKMLIHIICVLLFAIPTASLLAQSRTTPPIDTPTSKIYIDPVTRKRGVPPPGTAPILPSGLTNRVSTSSDGLKETPITTKAGGYKVHVGGRFQAALSVTNVGGKRILAEPLAPKPLAQPPPSVPEADKKSSPQ
jgi:hypothetical protein